MDSVHATSVINEYDLGSSCTATAEATVFLLGTLWPTDAVREHGVYVWVRGILAAGPDKQHGMYTVHLTNISDPARMRVVVGESLLAPDRAHTDPLAFLR